MCKTKNIEQETACHDHLIHLHQFCLFHQVQLMILKVLKLARHKYFANLATIMNFWRSPGTCHKIRKLWANTFKDRASKRKLFFSTANVHKERAADPCCTRVPPRPLKGRWGAAFACSSFLMDAGRDQTLAIIRMIMAPSSKKAKRKQTHTKLNENNERRRNGSRPTSSSGRSRNRS